MRTRIRIVLLCCLVDYAAGTASAQDWTKSKWGPNDEIGSANYMTPELVVKAASLVKTGKTYALGIPVDTTTPGLPAARPSRSRSCSPDRPATPASVEQGDLQ